MYLDGVVLCEGQMAAGGAEVGRARDSTPPLVERQSATRPSSDNMCSGAEGGAAWPLKESAPAAANALDHYRLQLYNYAVAERLRLYQPTVPACYAPYGPRLALSMSLLHHRAFHPEEPKPQHSYIGLIAMAILSSPEGKLVLSDIYQHILDNYPYFRSRGPGWRNSIRHNLSLNDCFVKAGRSANGKGHYWAVHPANVDDFRKGDFRRRKAQRKVRKHMGLAVDDDGEDSPSPPPQSPPPTALPVLPFWGAGRLPTSAVARKRQFDVASLLAPDDAPEKRFRRESSCEEEPEEDIDVVASDQEERGSETGSGGERSGAGEPCGLLGGWWPTLEPALLHQLRRHAAAAAAVPHHAERPPDT